MEPEARPRSTGLGGTGDGADHHGEAIARQAISQPRSPFEGVWCAGAQESQGGVPKGHVFHHLLPPSHRRRLRQDLQAAAQDVKGLVDGCLVTGLNHVGT